MQAPDLAPTIETAVRIQREFEAVAYTASLDRALSARYRLAAWSRDRFGPSLSREAVIDLAIFVEVHQANSGERSIDP
jgi:hypothetical protein